MTRKEAIERATKLLRLAQSENPNEAAIASREAQKLIDRWNIETAALTDHGEAEDWRDEDIVDYGEKGAPLDIMGWRKVSWRTWLADVVARANGCQIYCSRRRDETHTHIVGRASDAEVVRYLFDLIYRQIEQLTDKHGKGCGRTWRNNFRMGAISAIKEKLEEGKRQLRQEIKSSYSAKPGALVAIKQSLTEYNARGQAVEDWVSENMNLRSSYSSASYDSSARAQGKRAGRGINVGGKATGAVGAGTKRLK